MIVTVNAYFIAIAHKNERFARIINSNYATFDGKIPFLIARLLARPRNAPIEKISGSDLVPRLLQEAGSAGKRVFMLGAAPESNAIAVEIARSRYRVCAEGYSPPWKEYPFTPQWRDECRRRILAFRPHVLLVALGAPKQEFWMDDEREWLQEAGVELCIGCGGSLDFLSGKIRRAPVWVQELGLEGVYRLLVEPKWFRMKRLLASFIMFRYVFK